MSRRLPNIALQRGYAVLKSEQARQIATEWLKTGRLKLALMFCDKSFLMSC
ncbi:MAG: hypothetical protein NZ805_09395 [Armatimonadetes bacterium]|nr:hypothetical protein [Armatimonadota bacterium]